MAKINISNKFREETALTVKNPYAKELVNKTRANPTTSNCSPKKTQLGVILSRSKSVKGKVGGRKIKKITRCDSTGGEKKLKQIFVK